MAKRTKTKNFKIGPERGAILCAKHGTPVIQRASYGHGHYGVICPTCRAERQAEPARSLLHY